MAITYLGNLGGHNTNGGDVSLNTPAGLAQNDLTIAFGGQGSLGGSPALLTSLFDTLLSVDPNLDDHAMFGVFSKIMGATPDTTVVYDGQGGGAYAVIACIFSFRKGATETWDISTPTYNPNSLTPPAISVIPGDIVLVGTIASGAPGSTSAPDPGPTGYGNLITGSRTDTERVGIGACFKVIDFTGTETPGAFQNAGTATWYTWSMRIRAVPPAGGVELSGVFSSESEVNADLHVQKRLSTVINSASNFDSDLTVAKRLSSVINSVSTVDADIKVTRGLSSVISSESHFEADIRVSKSLSANFSSEDSFESNALVKKFLEVDIESESNVSASIFTPKRLSGNIVSVSSFIGNIQLQQGLSASISSVSNFSAAMTRTHGLQGVFSSVSEVKANLAIAQRLSGVISSLSSFSSDLTVSKLLSSRFESVSSMSAILTTGTSIELIGIFSSISSMVANISISIELSVVFSSISSMRATAKKTRAFYVRRAGQWIRIGT